VPEQITTAEVSVLPEQSSNYGLRAGVLGPIETLAQSVSALAPSTSPSLTIPLVFALAGNATWLVYALATGATLLSASVSVASPEKLATRQLRPQGWPSASDCSNRISTSPTTTNMRKAAS